MRELCIGLIWPHTGGLASTYGAIRHHVEARLRQADRTGEIAGVTTRLVAIDDGSTNAGSLSAARELVEEHDVLGVIGPDGRISAACDYLAEHGVPTVCAQLGPQAASPDWRPIFSAAPVPSPGAVASTQGDFLASQGVSRLAVVAYAGTPAAALTVDDYSASAWAAGIPTVFRDVTSVPVEASDIDLTELADRIISSGADGLAVAFTNALEGRLGRALRERGARLAACIAGGYGADLLENPELAKDKEGWFFSVPARLGAPFELASVPTGRLAADMRRWADLETCPSSAGSAGWMTTQLFLHGVHRGGGADVTRESFIEGLRSERDYNPYGGVFGPVGMDFADLGGVQFGLGPGNTVYVARLVDGAFVPVDEASPATGRLLAR